MVSFSINSNSIFQMPFFSIIIKKIFKWIMTYITTLENAKGIFLLNKIILFNLHHHHYHHFQLLDKKLHLMMIKYFLLVSKDYSLLWVEIVLIKFFLFVFVLQYFLHKLSILVQLNTKFDFVVIMLMMMLLYLNLFLVYFQDNANQDDVYNDVFV
jgi:hypothetical protein